MLLLQVIFHHHPYHLTFTSSCLLTLAVVVSQLQCVFLFSEWLVLFFLHPQKGNLIVKPCGRSPLSHRQMFTLSCLLILQSHPASLCLCVQQASDVCRTPVSFKVSRCFTWDTYQNIELWWKTTLFVMPGHVRSCQSKYWMCLYTQGQLLISIMCTNYHFCLFASVVAIVPYNIQPISAPLESGSSEHSIGLKYHKSTFNSVLRTTDTRCPSRIII